MSLFSLFTIITAFFIAIRYTEFFPSCLLPLACSLLSKKCTSPN
ncbi:hypothetical protein [Moorena producens]|nr:hypothetical protein [Moorena producens]